MKINMFSLKGLKKLRKQMQIEGPFYPPEHSRACEEGNQFETINLSYRNHLSEKERGCRYIWPLEIEYKNINRAKHITSAAAATTTTTTTSTTTTTTTTTTTSSSGSIRAVASAAAADYFIC